MIVQRQLSPFVVVESPIMLFYGSFEPFIVPTVAVLHGRTIEGVVQNDTIFLSREQSPWCSHMHIGVASSLLAVHIPQTINTILLFII